MKKELEVILLDSTINAEQLVATAAKLCYSSSNIQELLEKQTPEKIEKFIDKLISLGHESPLEHVKYTFGIQGISRACSHQLVRYRIASYSQQSQRYVDEISQVNNDKTFDYIIPPSIINIGKEKWFEDKMKKIQEWYDEISKDLEKEGIRGELRKQDARFLLPHATETKIIVTMNCRELLHFFKQRLCNRAQWEIREMALEMYKLVLKNSPLIFKYAGPSCLYGKCSEGGMSCGKTNEIREKFKNILI